MFVGLARATLTITTTFIIISGCVWILRVLTPSYDPISGDQYCHKTVYVFGLVFIGITLSILLILVVLALTCLLCCCCCAGLLSAMIPDDDEESGRTTE